MDFINFFFIGFSLILVFYIIRIIRSSKRTNVLVELLFLGVYLLVALFFLFPSLLGVVELVLGIPSAINFFLYLSILVLFFLVFWLYKKNEQRRQEISKLVEYMAIYRAKKK